MIWREVTKEEYEEAFQRIYQDVRDLIEKIEHDPDLDYEKGFIEWKQEIIRYQILHPLAKIEDVLNTEIEKLRKKKI
ncbi:hypothetical protein KAT95_03505 [Candidatus Parcubacteria bacterium]|nr:hypothetical protein [Candidatus Parcubacteria bacterium]